MAYSSIVNVAISINATPLTQAGFGTPLFICGHRQSADRVLEFASTAEMTGAPYNFPADHPAVVAAGMAFSQQPRVPTIKIGRRDMRGTVIPAAPESANASATASFIVRVNDTDYSITGTVDNSGDDKTAEDVVDAFITDFTGNSQLDTLSATKSGSAESASLVIQSVALGDEAEYFELSFDTNSGNITSTTYVAYENPSETLSAITQIDSDWYFVAVEERNDDQYVKDMRTALTGSGLPHLFFYASADVTNLTPYQAGNADLFAFFKDDNADNVVTFFHQNADQYVEMAYIGANAPYDAGSVTWANIQIANVGFSQDPTRGRPLTTVQKSALMDKSANYVELDAGVPFTRTGSTAGGEWIDVIRGVDWQSADLGTSLRAVLLNQKGGKIPYNDQGTAIIREVISSSLQRGVNRQFLDSYEVFVPAVADIALNDRLSRILTGVTFKGFLAGAIHEVTLTGEVTV